MNVGVLRDKLAEQIKRAALAREAGQAVIAAQYERLAAETRAQLAEATGDPNAGAAAQVVATYGLPPTGGASKDA